MSPSSSIKVGVTFTLKPEDLAILDADMKWAVEAGDFEIRVGASSEDIRLRQNLRVEKTVVISMKGINK